jgi:methylmalonyl-CoA epimerase
MIKRMRRVSVAVRDLEAALAFYRDGLGLPVLMDQELPDRKLRIVRLNLGVTELELMQATDPTGTIAEFIDRHGEGLHHIAMESDDLEQELATLLAHGFELFDREPRDGPDGRLAFVNPHAAGGVLLELDEAPPSARELLGMQPVPEGGGPGSRARITQSVSFLPRLAGSPSESNQRDLEEHGEVP